MCQTSKTFRPFVSRTTATTPPCSCAIVLAGHLRTVPCNHAIRVAKTVLGSFPMACLPSALSHPGRNFSLDNISIVSLALHNYSKVCIEFFLSTVVPVESPQAHIDRNAAWRQLGKDSLHPLVSVVCGDGRASAIPRPRAEQPAVRQMDIARTFPRKWNARI